MLHYKKDCFMSVVVNVAYFTYHMMHVIRVGTFSDWAKGHNTITFGISLVLLYAFLLIKINVSPNASSYHSSFLEGNITFPMINILIRGDEIK